MEKKQIVVFDEFGFDTMTVSKIALMDKAEFEGEVDGDRQVVRIMKIIEVK